LDDAGNKRREEFVEAASMADGGGVVARGEGRRLFI
jgi:hypothetical protein